MFISDSWWNSSWPAKELFFRNGLSDVLHVLEAGEYDLPVAFLETCPAFRGKSAHAAVATNPGFVIRRFQVLGFQWPSTAEANFGISLFQSMNDGYAVIEDKALAFPQAILRFYVL